MYKIQEMVKKDRRYTANVSTSDGELSEREDGGRELMHPHVSTSDSVY
jgi:hypothetical protein